VLRNHHKTFYLKQCIRFSDSSTPNRAQKKYVSSEKEPKISGATQNYENMIVSDALRTIEM
jgi:hypothetical protein